VSQRDPDEGHRRLQQKVMERNRKHYEKYPDNVEAEDRIVRHLADEEYHLILPDGQKLNVGRFLSMGISFGFHGGLDAVHDIVLRCNTDLNLFDFLTKPTWTRIQGTGSFEDHVLYAVMHESIYC
jgi:hypothetical protein